MPFEKVSTHLFFQRGAPPQSEGLGHGHISSVGNPGADLHEYVSVSFRQENRPAGSSCSGIATYHTLSDGMCMQCHLLL